MKALNETRKNNLREIIALIRPKNPLKFAKKSIANSREDERLRLELLNLQPEILCQ